LAGDWVVYGAFPEETVTLLRAAGAQAIAGDSDREVVAAAGGSLPAAATEPKREALAWTAAALSPGALAFLGELPAQRRMRAAGHQALLVHGSPAAADEHLWPHTPQARLAELAGSVACGLVACGHTHAAMDREAAGTRFLNPGSVGRPGDGDPRAGWALLELEADGAVTFTPRRVAYDHLAAAAAVRERGLPEVVSRMLAEGRGLKSLLADPP
jgi:diadenosine tetraphosphatase ApaH/serine/threonine PP2A family protein phosphatase